MKTRDLVEQLISILESNRLAGNTTLLLDGARNYDRPFFVLGVNLEYALEKCEGIPNAKPLSIFDLDKARGTGLPIMVDVDVLNWLMGKMAYEFDKIDINNLKNEIQVIELKNKLEKYQKTFNKRRDILLKISNMNWLERIFSAHKLIRQLFLLELKNN
jgi:hypothetical protein